MFKRGRLFFEQVEYPEQTRVENFQIGLRKQGRRPIGVWDKFLNQVWVTKHGIQTYWGVERRQLWGTPDLEAAGRRLVGALITDYPLDTAAFQVVKEREVPTWQFAPQQTLVLELADTPALQEPGGRMEVQHYPLVTSLPVDGTSGREGVETLLTVVGEVVRSARGAVIPLCVQVVWQQARPGSTRQVKQKRRAGDKWKEDTYRVFRAQLENVERARGKEVGYWRVTVRLLAPRGAAELVSGLNRMFTFKQVRVGRAIQRFQRGAFGRRVGISSIPLRRVLQVPTAAIFPPELLGTITVRRGAYGWRRRQPYPREGYIAGWDATRQDVCLDDAMLRVHLGMFGMTGSRKTSLLRWLLVEFARNPQNRMFVFDYVGEYVQLLDQLEEVILLRPGSEEFPLGINFLDWPRTLGLDARHAETWILRILETMIRGQGEFTAKMKGMLGQLLRRELLLNQGREDLEQAGTLVDLFRSLHALRTKNQKAKMVLKKRQRAQEVLTEAEETMLADYGNHDLTIEAIQNRLRELYNSPLREVFFVQRTTVPVEVLLTHHVLLDLSTLRRQGVSNALLRLFCEFVLLYLSRGVATRTKGQVTSRNIVVFEEAQQLVPEVLTKRTLADGGIPEELIGTLGGFGISFVFVSAQPGLLSRPILNGCHTKLVFPLHGKEAELLGVALGVAPSEIQALQAGECLLRAPGRGVCKITARTLREYSKNMLVLAEWPQRMQPSEVVQRMRAAYEVLQEAPLEHYSTLVDVIEDTVGVGEPPPLPNPTKADTAATEDDTEVLGCWARARCSVCTQHRQVVSDGMTLAETYWTKTKKTVLASRLKLYPLNPFILYQSVQELATKRKVDNPGLVALCAHWVLLDWSTNDHTIRKKCTDLFQLDQARLVALLMDEPAIQKLLEVSKPLFDHHSIDPPVYSLRDQMCEGCPLDKSLRDLFCSQYREQAAHRLANEPDLVQRLQQLYTVEFQHFLQECFTATSRTNPGASYCLATAYLKRVRLSDRQRVILLDIAQEFLAEVAARETTTHGVSSSMREVSTSDIETLEKSKTRVTGSKEGTTDQAVIQAVFAQHAGVVPFQALVHEVKEAGKWQSQERFYQCLKAIGVKSFLAQFGAEGRRTYFVHPNQFKHIKIPCQICVAKHNFLLTRVKNHLNLAGLIISDEARSQGVVCDLNVRYQTLLTYVEYTGGGREELRRLIQKAKANPKRQFAILVDWKRRPQSPYTEHLRYGERYKGQSNLDDAQILWETEHQPANVAFFTLVQLDELVAWCRTRQRGYTHGVGGRGKNR